jgi:hypothetical protein
MRLIMLIISFFYNIAYFFKIKNKKDPLIKEYLKLNTLDDIFNFIRKFEKYQTKIKWTRVRTKEYDLKLNKIVNIPYILYVLLSKIGYKTYLIVRNKQYDIAWRNPKGLYIVWNYGNMFYSRSILGCLKDIVPGKKKKYKIIKESK